MKLYSLLILFLGLFSLPLHAATDTDEKLVVFTVNYPLEYFATRIGGEYVEVHFPAPSDIDPAFWKPGTDIIGAYQKADLVLLNGANYAKWVKKASLSRYRAVNTSKSFQNALIQDDHAHAVPHSHGAGDTHSHAGTAFTTWLDFTQAEAQAYAILQILQDKRPQHAADFKKRYQELSRDLQDLDKSIRQLTEGKSQTPVLASHPVYQYMARRYDMNLKSLMWEPDVVPDKAQLNKLERLAKKHDARWMIWEDEPDNASVQLLKERGIESVVFNPQGNKPAKGDFMDTMVQNLENLRAVYLGGDSGP